MISVIVPSFNDWQFLDALLDSLYSEIAGHPFGLVIVDDHSNDGTEHNIRQLGPGINVVRPDEKSYFTRCCNAGLDWAYKNTDATHFLLLNSDIRVTKGWGSALVSTSKKMQAGIVGATLLLPSGNLQHAGGYNLGQHYDINKPWIRFRTDRCVPWVTGAAMCIERKTMELIGLLPVEDPTRRTQHDKQYDASDRKYCVHAHQLYGVNIAVSADCVMYHDTHMAEAVRRKRGDY